MKLKDHHGFTLIELMVVVGIIGLLATVIMASLNSANVKGKNTRRKTDLAQIRTALELYYSACGTYIVAQNCTGTTYGSGGIGFFNNDYGNGSVAKGLVDNHVAGGVIIDPTGNSWGGESYMIFVDANHYTLWATLAQPSAQEADTTNKCYFSSYDFYNYPANDPAVHNYCISN